MNLTNINALKKKYRRLSVRLHPDKGGDPTEFQTMGGEWDEIKDEVQKRHTELTKDAYGSKIKKTFIK